MMLAQVLGLKVGEFVHTLGDAHIYSNHLEQVETQLARKPGHTTARAKCITTSKIWAAASCVWAWPWAWRSLLK